MSADSAIHLVHVHAHVVAQLCTHHGRQRHRAAEEQMDQVIALLGKIGPGSAQFVEDLVGLVRRMRIRFDADSTLIAQSADGAAPQG
ncbi:hypothetical protein [Hydrogenibacillus sp. N12]|uniref:hypothetical protein n=1 Tax=Hydrogenibacillus sp. N12 TaxID=2866627 RepID=UPI001C7CB359|nr:hypothetical protein [Hydrogenibacillus sp. N12]QZA32479.1 hypothetical protein K2M58_09215 [Hydrogenibacillus sp. N12]